MADIKKKFSFHNITHEFVHDIIEKSHVFEKIYSYFNFYYLKFLTESTEQVTSSNTINVESFFKLFKENKLITYEISQISKVGISLFSTNKIILNDETNSDKNLFNNNFNFIFCLEKKCFIIDSIDIDFLNSILTVKNSEFIDVSEDDSHKRLQFNNKNENAIEEVSNFCNKYKVFIANNFCIDFTIKPIICYLIRRYYYPSNYFKDNSFFDFMNHNKNERKLKTKFIELFQLNNFDKLEENEEQIKYLISGETQNKMTNIEFVKNDFVKLRKIHNGDAFFIYLVIHLPTLHIMVLKKIKTPSNHEIEFCTNYSCRYFTPFYGLYKKNGNISGFVYEFMSKGNLLNFLSDPKNAIDPIFKFSAIIRISQGIKYIHSKNLVHRDLHPCNILIDNDNNVFISDFETIYKIKNVSEHSQTMGQLFYSSPEQDEGGKISTSFDIYPIGLIFFLIIERKNAVSISNPLEIIANKKKRISSTNDKLF